MTGRNGAALDVVRGMGEPAVVAVGVPARRFEELYRARVATTLAIVLGLRGRGVDAGDVVQEAFGRALGRWDQVSAMARPDLWVQRVAFNLATSRLRRRSAEARAVTHLATAQGVAPVAFVREQSFWDIVRRLPRKQARVVAPHCAGGLAVADIAALVGSSEGTVEEQLHAARQRLAVLLSEPGREAGS